jgi:hypothetical protein
MGILSQNKSTKGKEALELKFYFFYISHVRGMAERDFLRKKGFVLIRTLALIISLFLFVRYII